MCKYSPCGKMESGGIDPLSGSRLRSEPEFFVTPGKEWGMHKWSAFGTLLVATMLAWGPAKAQDSGPQVTVVDSVTALEVARLAGTVDGLVSQIETERALNAKVLDTINSILTVYTAAAALIVFVLGLFGYGNLRSHLQREIERKVEERLEGMVNDRLDAVVERKEQEWDDRFERLFRRVERLAEGG